MIRRPATASELAAARRVLVCLRWGIGDVLMEWPALQGLRRAAPRARIVALGAEPAVQLFAAGGPLDEIVSVGRLGFTHLGDDGAPAGRAALRRWLEEQGPFDLAFDALHAPRGVHDVLWRDGVATCEADQDVQKAVTVHGDGTVAAIAAAVESGWGVPVPRPYRPRLPLRDDDREMARGFFRRAGISSPVAVSPVGSISLKRWPTERFARVIEALLERTAESVLLLAGPQVQSAEMVLTELGGQVARSRVRVVGERHLLETAALLEGCRALICNDTGLMHLAWAVGRPVVGIFGPTSPRVLLPRDGAVAAGGEVPCPHRSEERLGVPDCWLERRCLLAPAERGRFGGRSCIDAVEPEEVVRGLEEVLGHGRLAMWPRGSAAFRLPARGPEAPRFNGAGGARGRNCRIVPHAGGE